MKCRLFAALFLLQAFLIVSIAHGQSATGAKELFGGGHEPSVVLSDTLASNDEPPPASAPERRPSRPAKKKPAATPAAPRVFGLSCWIELVEGAGQAGSQVTDSRIFKSGERIRLHFQGNSDGYIAIYQFGASGTASKLFPNASIGLAKNHLRADTDNILPSEKHWFRFDATAGTEKLMVVFAKNQADLDRTVPDRQALDSFETAALLDSAKRLAGSKDLVIETVESEATYAVNKANNIVMLELELEHR
jgi:hypothetical protein